jgi:hypothetical protein
MSPKNPAAVSLGRKGGRAYADNTSAHDRAERARKAAEARWSKQMKRIDGHLRTAQKLGAEADAKLEKLEKATSEVTAGTKKLLKKTTKKKPPHSLTART